MIIIYLIGDVITSRMESLESIFFLIVLINQGAYKKRVMFTMLLREGFFLDIIILDFNKKVGLSRFGKLCFRTS